MAEELSLNEKLALIDQNPKIKDKDSVKLVILRQELENTKDKEVIFRSIDKKLLEQFTGKPGKIFRLVNEKYGEQVEPAYFWLLGWFRDDLKAKEMIKVVDTFSASDTSVFMTKVGQSLAGVQTRISETLRTIGILTKELFKFAYEMKILEERMSLIYDGEKFSKENPFTGNVNQPPLNYAEMTLKDRYINLVEGGTKNPGSVYGLGSQVGFILVPDLFMRLDVFSEEDVGRVMKQIEAAQIPTKVCEVLGRKLRSYQAWRSATKRQLEHRAAFLLTYLKQHYNAIKLHAQWLRPYLQSAKRLQWSLKMKESPELIAAIEQSIIEIELINKVGPPLGEHFPVVNLYMTYRTFPETQYVPQQRGDVTRHTGRYEVELRGRSMTQDQITAYKILKEREEFELIGDIDRNLEQAIGEFGDSVQRYLKMDDIKNKNYQDFVKMILEGKKKTDERIPEKQKLEFYKGAAEPFTSLFGGFKEMFTSLVPIGALKFEKKAVSKEYEALKTANQKTWLTYMIFKKAHRFIQW